MYVRERKRESGRFSTFKSYKYPVFGAPKSYPVYGFVYIYLF